MTTEGYISRVNIVRTHFGLTGGKSLTAANINLHADEYAVGRLLRSDAAELRTGVAACVQLLTQPPLGQSYDITLNSWRTEYYLSRTGELRDSRIVQLGEVFLDYATEVLSGKLHGTVHEPAYRCREAVEYVCSWQEPTGVGERLRLTLYIPRVMGVLKRWDAFVRWARAHLAEKMTTVRGPLVHLSGSYNLTEHFSESLGLGGEICGVSHETVVRELTKLLERAREEIAIFEAC